MNECERISEALSAYLDGEEGEAEAGLVRAHLESCAGCRATLADWQAIDRYAVSVAGGPPPARVSRRRLAPVLAAAAVLALASASSVFAALRPAPAPPVARRAVPAVARAGSAPAPVAVASEPSERPTPEPSEMPTAKPTREPKEHPQFTRASDRELMLVAGVERSWYRAGEDVRVMVGLVNLTDRPVEFTAAAESPIDVVLRDGDGKEVWRRSAAEGWSGNTTRRTLAPRESVKEAVSFAAPAPGAYLLSAECLCLRGDVWTRGGERGSADDTTISTGKDRPTGRPLVTPPIKLAVRP
ncbi:MAG: zf-HC2 domain-containing protein [Acidobacteria bacterium]|nr:zf-HC2 domain-containing protein [Acidobacteriota bacterium]